MVPMCCASESVNSQCRPMAVLFAGKLIISSVDVHQAFLAKDKIENTLLSSVINDLAWASRTRGLLIRHQMDD